MRDRKRENPSDDVQSDDRIRNPIITRDRKADVREKEIIKAF